MRGIPYSGVNNLLWRWNWNHLSESCFTFTVTSKSNCKRLLSSTRYLAMDTSNSRTYFQSHPTTLQVHPGKPGKLYIDLGAAPSQSESQNPGQILNLSVIPAKYPETLSECIAGVQLFGKDESILEDSLHHLVKVAFSDEEKATVMKVTINQMDEMPKEDLHLEISVPHSFDVYCDGRDSECSIKVSQMECKNLHMHLKAGSCELFSVKALESVVYIENGNLLCIHPFIGNGQFKIGNGSVVADRLQGQKMFVSTVSGNIHVQSLYASESSLTTTHGDIHIGSCHGQTNVKVAEGNIDIRSSDGVLHARTGKGDISVHLSQTDNVDLSSQEGHVDVTCSDSSNHRVVLETHQLETDDNLILDITERDARATKVTGSLGENGTKADSWLRVRASSIRLGILDWFSAQKLMSDKNKV